jgi:hypothetical protein
MKQAVFNIGKKQPDQQDMTHHQSLKGPAQQYKQLFFILGMERMLMKAPMDQSTLNGRG